jgi:hypothetical protein
MEYLNRYHCATCGEYWNDVWSCGCNDKCPECNKETEPYESVELLDPEDDDDGSPDD